MTDEGRDRSEVPGTQLRDSEQRPSVAGGDAIPPGTRIGAYRVEELRCEGGFAALYRATHLDTGTPVALKVLHSYLTIVPQALDRLRQEAETLALLQHPSIVRVLECGEMPPRRPYIAMEWLEGKNLEELLQERGPFSAAEALSLMEPLCSALAAAHERGIIHRDIKAQNVVAVPTGSWFAIKLVDFGIAKLLDRGRRRDLTASSQVIGTPLTMAPEQILGQAVDARTDIYALGLLLYQLLVGRLPFRGASAVETEELHLQAPPPRASEFTAVPAAVDTVLQRSLEKSRVRRQPSAREFFAELERAVTSSTPGPASHLTVGLYVHARTTDQARERPEEALDDLETVLLAARAAILSLDMQLAVESADAVLGVAPLPESPEEAFRFRRQVLNVALDTAAQLAARPNPLLRVSLCAHVAEASSRKHGGRAVLGGELLRIRDWTGGHPGNGVMATTAMLGGLEAEVVTISVPDHQNRWIVQQRAG